MGQQTDYYKEWFASRGGSQNSRDESAVLAAARAFDRAHISGKLSTRDLRLLIETASHQHVARWSCAVDMLGYLSATFTAVQIALVEMSKNGKANIRFASLCSLRKTTPNEISEQIVQTLLSDRSQDIRRKAANTALSLNLKSVLPALNASLKFEKVPEVKRNIKFCRELLDAGYRTRKTRGNRWEIIVTLSYGIVGKKVSDVEFQEFGAVVIAEKIRKEEEAKWQ